MMMESILFKFCPINSKKCEEIKNCIAREEGEWYTESTKESQGYTYLVKGIRCKSLGLTLKAELKGSK
jgi:hypothetical protein